MLADVTDTRTSLETLVGERHHAGYMPGAAEDIMASVRLHHAETEEDFRQVHALAVCELGPGIASLEEVRRVEALTGAAMWVIRRNEAVTGFLAPLALTAAGISALLQGRFDARAINAAWVARLGQPIAGFYCWCYAGKDQVSRGALVYGLRQLIDLHFPDLPFFGKASTPAGERIMHHLGFLRVNPTSEMMWRCRNRMEPVAA